MIGMKLCMVLFAASVARAEVTIPVGPVGSTLPLPPGTPHPQPTYAVNNINNQEGAAPDKGVLAGPVLAPLNDSLIRELHKNVPELITISDNSTDSTSPHSKRQNTDSYWLSILGSKGKMPLAPSGYQYYRNVKDFGATGNGVTDDTAAINRAAAAMSSTDTGHTRCGADCGSTTTLGALVYFPPGTYVISSPIIQYYYTQFVGNPSNKAVIKGAANFSGIALIDNDMYIPGGNGAEWYINQSNFYRQVRNFVFDMTAMNWTNWQGDQQYVPAGIHWQVGQATSITNCDFKMAVSTATQSATAIGIYMENGSGGTVADLTFFGGNIGFLAGSQQFTATNLQFTSCLTAIKHVWNWGFTWKNIYVFSCYIALDCTEYSDTSHQGTGSITVLDSHFNGVPYAITLKPLGTQQPNIVLDNLLVENSESVVLISGGATLLPGSSGALYFDSWASGIQYQANGKTGRSTGFVSPPPKKSNALLDASGRYLVRSKPQYQDVASGSIIVATDQGVSNLGTGDQTSAINMLLSGHVGSVIFFPAGVYLVQGTVKVPVGSKIIGSGWSQIMGTGSFFADASNPKVMVQVGNSGDSGVVEISDMLFTVKGSTAGCILMEWNVHESTQGSAAMWDSHFRVGGATSTSLQLADCPTGGTAINNKCMAAFMLMHVTKKASGYFDNVWLWVADHDLDNPLNAKASESPDGIPLNVQTQISIYSGRGLLVESQGPTWFYGTASEHSQMYQYQLNGAANIYFGHMQTETPYYQPNPTALTPYKAGQLVVGDPTFDNCNDNACKGAWALRIINSTDVFIYSAGFYSFFQNNQLGCTSNESCQLALVETSYSQGLWLYNLFTKGNVQIVTPRGGLLPVLFNDTTRNGYTSEIAAWLVLALNGGNLGSSPNATNGSGSGDVYIDPTIWRTPNKNISCIPPCTYILPPSTLPTTTTIHFPPIITPLEVGWTTSTTFTGPNGKVSTTTTYVTVTVTTTIIVPDLQTTAVNPSNVPIVSGINTTTICVQWSIEVPPIVITDDRDPNHAGTTHPVNTRTITPKPWPWHTYQNATSPTATSTSCAALITHHSGPPGPICTGGCGHKCSQFCSWPCPSGCNTNGADCTIPICTKGGDCAGPDCTKGGNCEGPRCTRGGDCTGPHCHTGGDCSGPNCDRGGDCDGNDCEHGGGCKGANCRHGGGCGPGACPPGGCSGPNCGSDDKDNNYCDSNDPNCRQSRSSEECTTSTYSSCRTLCTAATTCSSTCSEVIGCRTTGSSWTSTVTLAPAYTMGRFEDWVGYLDYGGLETAGQGIVSLLSSDGDFTTSPPTTTTTTTTSQCVDPVTHYPTQTAINQDPGEGFCYNPNNAPHCNEVPYREFTVKNAQDVILSFCNAHYVLQPGDSLGKWVSIDDQSTGITITVSAFWADDQSGCGAEQAFAFSDTDVSYSECLNGWNTDFFCTDLDGNQQSSYGGAYVLHPPNDVGCLWLELKARPIILAAPRLPGGNMTSQTVQPQVSASPVPTSGPGNLTHGGVSPWPALNTTLNATNHHAQLFSDGAISALLNGTGPIKLARFRS